MRFDSPLGTPAQRDQPAWPGGWFEATSYGEYYTATGKGAYHTGADLNLPNYGDVGQPVHASAAGVVVYVGPWAGWQRQLVCIQHTGGIWTRYAHLDQVSVTKGQTVQRGQHLGNIGDYNNDGAPSDHLHFDIARIDLGAKPGDWPGMDLARVKRDYIDPKPWINAHRGDELTTSKWTPTSTDGTRVRLTPTTTSNDNIIGVIPSGARVDGEKVGDWINVRLTPGQVRIGDVALTPSVVTTFAGYASAQYMRAVTQPPTPPPRVAMGVSVLISHNLLQTAYDQGCRAFLIMEGLVTAVQFKIGHPDAVVMYRRWLPHGSGIPDPAAFSGEARMGNGVVFVTPLNECDNYCYGSPGEIEERAKFDAALGAMCKQHGTIYAAGGFSMGTPDFTSPAICDAMRRHYAPAYNANLFGMNMHLYSPSMSHIYEPAGWQWYERRWEFLFTKCGFDPSPGHLGIYCDETGVDEGGVGGFPAHGASGLDVQRWAASFASLSKLPLSIGGVEYPSPFRAAAVFQAGDTNNWRGYNVQPYMAEIGRSNQ